ncbi:SDR family NAD(P)-dependent oxidoreductase [Mycolicibacterium sp.]|uniref:SDR family NAD(P)-dependent oxidoreductase n=1 Tax=Mycolicibacterium sp. TaxID=2320850 RepID=UPI003D14107B
MGVLDGRVAIITGGGRGIGEAIARLYAAEGAQLVINDLGGDEKGDGQDSGPAEAIAKEINDNGGAAVADGGDVADVATGERLVQLALDTYGKLDIVANVAGILRDKMIFNLTEHDWDAVIRVHLKGHYSTIRPASAYWRAQRNPEGNYRIINFTSGSGLHGSPGQPNYAAAKMGIVGLTMSLANGLGRYGVTANAIAPGAATRLVATMPQDKRFSIALDLENEANSPKRVAPAAVFLGSAESSWLTGRTIAAGGDELSLYNVPEIISTIEGTANLDYAALRKAVESTFRPLADGPAPSMFAAQMSS